GKALSNGGRVTAGATGAAGEDVFDLSGRIAVITGAGTGIGRATALVLAARGAHVVLAGRREDNLQRVAGGVGRRGGRSLVVATDVLRPEACERLIETTVDELGSPDVLVNNAG